MKKKIIALLATISIALPSVSVFATNGPGMQIKTKTENATTAATQNNGNVNSSNTSNAGKEAVKLEIPKDLKGEKVSDEEALKILSETSNVTSKIESYDMYLLSLVKFMGQEILTESEGQIFPIKKEASIKVSYQGLEQMTYMKDMKSYRKHPQTGLWIFNKIVDSTEAKKDKIEIDPNVLQYLTVEKTADGYIIKTKEKVELEKLSVTFLNGSDTNAAQELKKSLGEDAKIVYDVFVLLDKDYRQKELYYDMTTTFQGQTFYSFMKYVYSNYNNAKPVEIPSDVLNAKEEVIATTEEAKTTTEVKATENKETAAEATQATEVEANEAAETTAE